jgi:hypothetical protein
MAPFFRHARYPGCIERDLAGALQFASAGQNEQPASKTLSIVGPIGLHQSSAQSLLRSRRIPSALPQVGWRVLLLEGKRPAAIFDIGLDRIVSCIRGSVAAQALAEAIVAAHAAVQERGFPPRSRQLRILAVPEVFCSGLWMPGRPTILIPLRLGSAPRAKPHPISTGEFITAVGDAVSTRRRRQPRSAAKAQTERGAG